MDTRFDFRAFVFALTACAFLGISLPDAQAQTQGGGGGGGGAGGEETGDKAGSDVVSRQLGQFSVTNFAGFVGRQISRAGGNLGALILTVDLPGGCPRPARRTGGRYVRPDGGLGEFR